MCYFLKEKGEKCYDNAKVKEMRKIERKKIFEEESEKKVDLKTASQGIHLKTRSLTNSTTYKIIS